MGKRGFCHGSNDASQEIARAVLLWKFNRCRWGRAWQTQPTRYGDIGTCGIFGCASQFASGLQTIYLIYMQLYVHPRTEWLILSYTMDISHLMHPQMPNISWPWNIGNMMISDSWGKMPKSGTLGHMLGRHHLQCAPPSDVCVLSPPHEYFTVVFAYHKP